MASQNFFDSGSALTASLQSIPQYDSLPAASGFVDGTIAFDKGADRLVVVSGGAWVSSDLRVGDVLVNDAGTIGSVSDPDAVSIAANGNVSLTQGLSVTNAVSAASAAVTGAVTAASVTATGAVSGASVTATGAVSGATVSATGAVSGASVAATGAVTGSSLTLTNDIELTGGGSIGSTSVPTAIQIEAAGDVNFNGAGRTITIGQGQTGPNGIEFGDETDPIFIYRRTAGNTLTIESPVLTSLLVIDRSTKDVTVSAGNLVIGTSGKGIDFSATPGTGTSELLDDYEEGTWTPTVTDGTNNATYVTQVGLYKKIGNTVFVEGLVWVNSIGSVGNARIAGLPFAIGGSSYPTFSFGYATSLNGTAGYNLSGYGSPGDSFFRIARWDAAGGTTEATGTELSDSAQMRFNGFYEV